MPSTKLFLEDETTGAKDERAGSPFYWGATSAADGVMAWARKRFS